MKISSLAWSASMGRLIQSLLRLDFICLFHGEGDGGVVKGRLHSEWLVISIV